MCVQVCSAATCSDTFLEPAHEERDTGSSPGGSYHVELNRCFGFRHVTLLPVNHPPAPAIPAVVVIADIVKRFGRFAALRSVTEEFLPGRLYVILGDNGAGKTTLLRILAGLTRPTSGTVSILESSEPRAAAREIGYMAHPSLLYDEMSGLENLRYFARLYGIEDDERCERVVRRVGLDPSLTRPVGQYSQGMRQRMSLARALLHDPKILLLDEPFSNVDLRSAVEMVRLLAAVRDAGTTVFAVTHQPSLLQASADEFVWMEAGTIVARTSELPASSDGPGLKEEP
jgi:ABC-type multidrug transport system ATPase subunit